MDIAAVTSSGFIVLMSMIPIYTGSLYSIKYRKHFASDVETVNFNVAKFIPIMISLTLLVLYVLFMFLAKELVNKLLLIEFLLYSSYCLWRVITAFFTIRYDKENTWLTVNISAAKKKKEFFKLSITSLDFLASIASVMLLGAYAYTGNWFLSNIIAISVTFCTLLTVQFESFYTGLGLLYVLLLVDVFWVFATDVMVTVAKNLNIPIKLVFPYSLARNLLYNESVPSENWKFNLLGLGDVVLPGIFITYCITLDYTLHLRRSSNSKSKNSNFNKPYFYISLFGYLSGLIMAIYISNVYKVGQPALLYLVPSVTIPVVLLLIIKGEFKTVSSLDLSSPESIAPPKPSAKPVKVNARKKAAKKNV